MAGITQPGWEQHPELPARPLVPWLLLPPPTVTAVTLQEHRPSNSSYSFKTTLLLYLCIYDQQPRAADKP